MGGPARFHFDGAAADFRPSRPLIDRPVLALLAAGSSLGVLEEALAAEGIRIQEVEPADAPG
ncbi:MAG TPA: hypothetical protein VFW38_05115 [Solirubrobacteraceae bacterium]|nr:hypothetical protein [Solirubrobacteraceae bacterium]